MPPTARWLLAIPDALRQLEALDRDWLARRDLETLFGVSRAQAANLMRTFGAVHTGGSRLLGRADLIRQLKKHQRGKAFQREQDRRDRVLSALQQARITGIRVAVPTEALSTKLANLPEGVSVERGKIEVRFEGAKEAVARLFALAQALTNDYTRFEAVVEGGGGEAGR